MAVVVLVMFGSKKLPDTARALGQSLRVLKSEAKATKDEAGRPERGTVPLSRTARGTSREPPSRTVRRTRQRTRRRR